MENDFLGCHNQVHLSALMDFENFIEKWTTCN